MGGEQQLILPPLVMDQRASPKDELAEQPVSVPAGIFPAVMSCREAV